MSSSAKYVMSAEARRVFRTVAVRYMKRHRPDLLLSCSDAVLADLGITRSETIASAQGMGEQSAEEVPEHSQGR